MKEPSDDNYRSFGDSKWKNNHRKYQKQVKEDLEGERTFLYPMSCLPVSGTGACGGCRWVHAEGVRQARRDYLTDVYGARHRNLGLGVIWRGRPVLRREGQ